jgi:hypothetical protein
VGIYLVVSSFLLLGVLHVRECLGRVVGGHTNQNNERFNQSIKTELN